MNNKMGGDLKKIQTVGQYMVEARHRPNRSTQPCWCRRRHAPFAHFDALICRPAAPSSQVWKAVGMDMARVEFLSSSEEINGKAAEYWCGSSCCDTPATASIKSIRFALHERMSRSPVTASFARCVLPRQAACP